MPHPVVESLLALACLAYFCGIILGCPSETWRLLEKTTCREHS